MPGIGAHVQGLATKVPVTEDDFWEIISNDFFKAQVEAYIIHNASSLFESFEHKNPNGIKHGHFPDALIKSILRLDELNTSEVHLLYFVTEWAMHDKHYQGHQKTITIIYTYQIFHNVQ